MRFETRVAGIPCVCHVTYFDQGSYQMRGHPDSWEEPEPAEIEYNILDLRGRLATWLAVKALPSDHDRIYKEALEALRSPE